jgi:hypothetical protein
MSFTVDYTNWQTAAKLEELRLAYSERMAVTAGGFRRYGNDVNGKGIWSSGDASAADVFAIGTDAHHVNFMGTMQGFAANADVLDRFVSASDSPKTFAELAGESDMTPFEFLCKEVLGTETGLYDGEDFGFRRSTDGETFSRGAIQAGDIIGEWLFEDLASVFDVLLLTKADLEWDVDAEWTEYEEAASGSSWFETSIADAKSFAEAVYGPTFYHPPRKPQAYAGMDRVENDPDPDQWQGYLYSSRNVPQPATESLFMFLGGEEPLAEVVDYFTEAEVNHFFLATRGDGDEFQDGLGYVENAWNAAGTEKELDEQGDVVGSLDVPEWPEEEMEDGSSGVVSRVFNGVSPRAVIDWKFSDQGVV